MEPTPLNELTPRSLLASIEIKVLRKWEFRGNNDAAPIAHVGMVFVDQQGNAMYVEIPEDLVDEKAKSFEENNVYRLSRFRTANPKPRFRPVAATHMIYITVNTQITTSTMPTETFPLYVYTLTPISQLESKIGDHVHLIDVIGILTGVSPLQYSNQGIPSASGPNREIFIKDHSNNTLKITLWGKKATDFSLADVYDPEQQNAIVILIVGCILKRFPGQTYLNGNASCFWYFNPDIEEVKPYYTIFGSDRVPLYVPNPAHEAHAEPEIINYDHKTVAELHSTDPYAFLNQKFQCSVTITSVPTGMRWWFPACTKCSKSSTPESNGYKCYQCDWTGYTYRYKLSFIASDGTAEANMFCFNNVAKQIIGRPCEAILRSLSPTAHNSLPPEIARIVSSRYTFVVTLTENSLHFRNRVYQIVSILESSGQQNVLPSSSSPAVHQGPSTPNKLLLLPSSQISPSTAMRRLTTESPEPPTVIGNVSGTKKLISASAEPLTPKKKEEDTTSNSDTEDVTIESPPKRSKHFGGKHDSTSAKTSNKPNKK